MKLELKNNANYELLIRALLIILGLFLIINSLIKFWNLIEPLLNQITIGNIELIKNTFDLIDKDKISIILIQIIIGFSLYKIGINWKNIFKELTIWIISLGVFFFSISIFLFVIHSNSNLIVNDIQPSIDYLISSSIENLLNETNYESNLNNNYSLDLLLFNNYYISEFYVSNISLEQSKYFTSKLNINYSRDEDKIEITKILISSIFDSQKSYNELIINTPIPIETIKEILIKSNININDINNIPISLVKSFYNVNNDARLNIIISNESINLTITPNNLENNSDLIWKNLIGLNNISKSSKIKIEKLIFSYLPYYTNSLPFDNIKLPLITLSSLIPNDIKEVINYDLLNEDLLVRSNNLKILRDKCISNKSFLPEICPKIIVTDYNYLLENISSTPEINSLGINFSKINSINKLNNEINNKTSKWKIYLIYGIICFLLGLFFYYLHFKLFNRELILIHIPYYISKLNLYNLIFIVILFSITQFLLISDKIITIINSNPNENFHKIFNIILNLPIYKDLININQEILLSLIYYFIASIIIYIILFFLLKKEVNKYENI